MTRRYWNINLEEMMEAGVHFGHGTKKWNPRMAPYISAKRKGALLPWKIIQLPHGELAAPTNDINTTVALALLTHKLIANVSSIQKTPVVKLIQDLMDKKSIADLCMLESALLLCYRFYILYPIWTQPSVDELVIQWWPLTMFYNFLLGVACYMGREGNLVSVWYGSLGLLLHIPAPLHLATAVFLIYPIGQEVFSEGMPLGISGTFNFMIVFQAEHNILMAPFQLV
ncbi:hypothetical protein C4D60_Mb00t13010 [Musa balbisiana]|uniref:30S ribosomal protein S2, chloroplastic n=1 Tax=Musa balbisiana TaxID=52838 RepID=A0A4S8I637_MUSBA|nr:hypothetical protein C4D60_Mb00t13010 [Musa balbisiana]